MATTLVIPKRYERGFARLADLDEASYKMLVKVLRGAKIALGVQDLIADMGVSDPKQSDAFEEILASAGSLSIVGEHRGSQPAELAKDVVEYVSRGGVEGVTAISSQKADILRARVEELITIDSVYYSSKAADLVTESERVVHTMRIITDCRPIFGREIDPDVKTAVIFHTLQIHYHGAGEHKEIYFTMDSEDLSSLKKAIERAEKKANILMTSLLKPEIKPLE